VQSVETEKKERAVLVGVATQSSRRFKVEEYLDELAFLAESAGADIVARILQERQSIDAAFFIGSGKAEEVSLLVGEKNIDIVIFDDDLSPVQVRNLEKMIKCKIVDRSGLILDIFASRARSREAKTQVQLAQLQYMLPRLTRQWTHLSKQYGGIGTKGPGETQIETDRRAIRTSISNLTRKLQTIGIEREVQRKGREHFPRVALVGYTNAGKSTLLNYFSDAGVLVEDKLFATLDATVRLTEISSAHRILLSDTVGFIRKLPHHLIASFKSTLDEVREADILLHVVDVSHPLFEEHVAVVGETLEEIGVDQSTPVIMVFNKIDRLENRGVLQYLASQYTNGVFISAMRGINIEGLKEQIIAILERHTSELTMTFSQREYDVISRIHDIAEVLHTSYEGENITMKFRIDTRHAEWLRKIRPQHTFPPD